MDLNRGGVGVVPGDIGVPGQHQQRLEQIVNLGAIARTRSRDERGDTAVDRIGKELGTVFEIEQPQLAAFGPATAPFADPLLVGGDGERTIMRGGGEPDPPLHAATGVNLLGGLRAVGDPQQLVDERLAKRHRIDF